MDGKKWIFHIPDGLIYGLIYQISMIKLIYCSLLDSV